MRLEGLIEKSAVSPWSLTKLAEPCVKKFWSNGRLCLEPDKPETPLGT